MRGKQNIGSIFVKPSRQESRGLPRRASYTEVESDESYKSDVRVCVMLLSERSLCCVYGGEGGREEASQMACTAMLDK